MPKTFDQLARSGLIDTARGMLRQKFGSGTIPSQGEEFTTILRKLRDVGGEPGDIDHETARSVLRRAITSLNGANRLNGAGGRLRPNQHGFDPSFSTLTDRRYLYRVLVFCYDGDGNQLSKSITDVESDQALTKDQIDADALDAIQNGRFALTGKNQKYPMEGGCEDVEIQVAFAVRTR